jgi:hypothetical protein
LKRTHLAIAIILILSSSYVIEYYTNMRFPKKDLVFTGVPELEIGVTHEFTYLKQLEPVGTYSYTITGKSNGVYTMTSNTDASLNDNKIQIDSTYLFDEQYKPQHYSLTARHGDQNETFNITFTGGAIDSVIQLGNKTVTLTDELPEGGFLLESNMPGFWEILLLSTDLEAGQRYMAKAYIPQGGMVFDLEFYVSPSTKNINVNGEELACTLIQESTLSLNFYMYEGKLVEMEDTSQDLLFERVMN